MGVVHLARRPGGERVALKVLRPHIVGDDEARARLAREVSSLTRVRSRWVAEIVDSDPWGDIPYVATRYVPGLSLHEWVAGDGPDRGRRPALARPRAGRGDRHGARRRRPAPRRQALQRADGGAQPDPDRLRPGPGRRRPEADPHRLAARHPRLPRPRDPARRRRRPGLRHPLLGRDGRVRRHRPRAVRARPVDGDHGPGTPRPARPLRAPRRPGRRPRRGPGPRPGAAPRPAHAHRLAARAPPRADADGGRGGARATSPRTSSRSRWRWPRRPTTAR